MLITADKGNQNELYKCNETFKGKIIISSPRILYGLDIQLKYDSMFSLRNSWINDLHIIQELL